MQQGKPSAQKDRVVIVCPQETSSFVQQDASMLASRFEVELLGLNTLRSPKVFWTLRAVGALLRRKKIAVLLMWFSVPHLAPIIVVIGRLYGVKIIAITGGFDVAYVPAIEWGEMGSPWKRVLQRFSLHRVDAILPFSDFSREDTLRYAPPGIVTTVYPGIDCRHFTPSGEKSDLVVTTCNVVNRFTIIQKGLDVFARCAAMLPDYRFTIIGLVDAGDERAKRFRDEAPSNMTFTEQYIPDDELLSLYRRAKVYVQASAHEGFGIACAEAMACECVPVGTLNTSLPEVIGEAGFLVPYNDVTSTVASIKQALGDTALGITARKRIVEKFSPEQRAARMLTVINNILRT